MQQAGISNKTDARGAGCFNHRFMLGFALAHFTAGNQQQLIDASEGGSQASP